MTPPPAHTLSILRQRFPDLSHLWAGSLRLWRALLPVRDPSPPRTPLADWVSRAVALGPADPAAVAAWLGLPEHAVAAALAEARPVRRPFAFLDLPDGLFQVPPPATAFPRWPEPVTPDQVPPAVLRPTGVEVVSGPHDLGTVPVVWAEQVPAVAVRRGDGIEVYAAGPDGEVNETALWQLPADALPVAQAAEWSAAWADWCRAAGRETSAVRVEGGVARVGGPAEGWLWAGAGLFREAAAVEVGD